MLKKKKNNNKHNNNFYHEHKERLVIRLPSDIAEFFRQHFKHGERSKFVAQCIRDYMKKEKIRKIEKNLRQIVKEQDK